MTSCYTAEIPTAPSPIVPGIDNLYKIEVGGNIVPVGLCLGTVLIDYARKKRYNLPIIETMTRRKTHSPVSLFSFQDIIMSVVGIVILITLILLLQLVSQMLAAPPSPVFTEQELRQRIAALQPVLKEIQDSIAELQRVKALSEVFTPSVDRVDALQSTLERLESEIAHSEKYIEEIENRTDTLRNSPAIQQLEKTQQEIQVLTETSAESKRQTNIVLENIREVQEKVRELKAKNADLDTQLAGQAAMQLKVTIPKESGKTAFILDYGQETINIIPTDGSPKQTFYPKDQFFAWVSRRDHTKEHFVVYLRPSQFGEPGEEIINLLRAEGFDVGLQVIGEKTRLFL